MLELTTTQWILAAVAAFTVGVSKSGIKGIATIIVTILALVFGSKQSTGILMPLLIVGDIIAVFYYKREVVWKHLFQLLPWMIFGVLVGVFVGKDLPEFYFKKIMAAIILVTVVMMFYWERNKDSIKPIKHWAFAGFMGSMAGFTTMLGNLAGAFSNIYFLTTRLPKMQFIGTAAWLFLFINLFKLPFHIFAWETISTASFAISLKLIPIEIIGFIAGFQIVKVINENFFRKMILILTALGAILIFVR